MGDVNVSSGDGQMSIETLRKLALLSMPKRQGRNSTLSNPPSKSEGPTVFSSPAAKPPEDKEEGELSSDDDAEGASATLASAGPASNQPKAALKLHISSLGSSKEMLAPGANFSCSNPNEGLSTASVAEAFLASLRIPVPKPSRAPPGEEIKEDDFVIKFDEDSEDSDGEHLQSLTSSFRKLGSSAEKVVLRSVSLPHLPPVSQPVSALPIQKPSELKSEIDRVKKQIAIMERSKVKLPAAPVIPKSTRVMSPDMTRPGSTAVSEPKSVVHGVSSIRPVPDLESLRLQIAAKESELQKRRQRLTVKASEGSKVVGDGKGIGVGLPTTTPQATRTNKERNHQPGPQVATAVITAEKAMVPVRKEVSNQTEGLIALASAGPSGVCLPKKDARPIKDDSRVDLQTSNEDVIKLQSFGIKTSPNNTVGKQPVSKSTKRSHIGGDSADKRKVARIDSRPLADDHVYGVNMVVEAVSLDSATVNINGSPDTSAVDTGGRSKRKVDDVETSERADMEVTGSHAEGMKKLKVTTKTASDDTSEGRQLLEPNISGPAQTLLAPRSTPSTAPPQLQGENTLAVFTSSSEHVVGTATTTSSITARISSLKDEEAGRRKQMTAATVEEILPGISVHGATISPCGPTLPNGSEEIFINQDEHASKTLKPKFQYETSHALPALAGVSVPHPSLTEPVVTERLGNKDDLVLQTQDRTGDEAKSSMGLRSVLFPAEVQLEQTSERAEIWDDDPDAEMLDQLQREEELLDKELEEAQEERRRCERRERAARKEYREAQRALRDINTQCQVLNQRKEFLLSHIHQAEGRHYSRKLVGSWKPQLISSAGRPPLRLTGLEELASPPSTTDPAKSADQWALSLPSSQTSREPNPPGSNGGTAVIRKLGTSLYNRQEPPAVSEAGATSLADGTSAVVSRVAPSISRLQGPVVHSLGTDSKKMSASDFHPEGTDFPSAIPAHAATLPAGTLSPEVERTATKVVEGSGGSDAPKGFKAPRSPLGPLAAGSKMPSGTMVIGKQAREKSDGSLPPFKDSNQQSRESLAATFISESNLSPPLMAQVVTGVAGTAKDDMGSGSKRGSHPDTVEVSAEEVTELSRAQGFVSDNKRIDGADRGCSASSRQSMAGSRENNRLQGKLVEKSTVRRSVLGLSASSAGVPLRKNLQPEHPHNIPSPKASKSGEYGSSITVGTASNNQVSGNLPSINDKTCDASRLEHSIREDSLRRTDEDSRVQSSSIDGQIGGDSDAGRSLVINREVDRSSVAGQLSRQEVDNSANLTMSFRGMSFEGMSLNRVEKPDLDTGINLPSKATRGGCQVLLKSSQLDSSGTLPEGDKTGPAAVNMGSSRRIPVYGGRGSRVESVRDLPVFLNHARPPEHNRKIGVNISAQREPADKPTGSDGGIEDMDTLEPVKILENLESVKAMEQHQPGSAAESQGHKTVRDSDSSMELHSIPVDQAIAEPKGQHSLKVRLRKNNNGTTECLPINDLTKERPTESCPRGPNLERVKHDTVASETKSALVTKPRPKRDVISEDGCHLVSYDNHRDPRMQNQVSEDQFGLGATFDRVTQNLDVRKLKKSVPCKDLVSRKEGEVEVSGRASLEGSARDKSSGGDEAVAVSKVQTQRIGVDKQQILPEMQRHLFGQLQDVVDAGIQSNVVQEEVCWKGSLIANLENEGFIENLPAQLDISTEAVKLTEAPEVPGAEKGDVLWKMGNKVYSRDYSMSKAGVPSAVGLTSLGCIRGTGSSPVITAWSKESLEVVDKKCASVGNLIIHPKYESPLAVFRAYRSLPQFASAMQLSSNSNTWTHAINPHKPLCRFEHRGQCRNEHCPWQHVDDYTLSSETCLEMQRKESLRTVSSDGKTNGTGGFQLQAVSFVRTSPGSVSGQHETSRSLVSSNGLPVLDWPSKQLHDYDVSVPIYRIGYFTVKAEDPNNIRLPGIPQKAENEMYHSFLLAPSVHRTLHSESPCLTDGSWSKLTVEAQDAAKIPHWRYSELQEERLSLENGPLHASKDVEMWVELALNLIDFDLATDKHKERDEALCILSRGLETKQQSVTLWMAYCCIFHTRRDNPGKDDMFHFAIQYIPGSYELWLLYINSRHDLPSRLDAYERAIVALAEKRTQGADVDVDSSACLLDITLQMLYCMCFSGATQESLAWVEDLIYDTADEGNCRRGSTSALLSHLTRRDLCILWVTCAYLSACEEIPLAVIRRLGCRQELPYTLDWRAPAVSEKRASVSTLRIFSTAGSSRKGCLSLEDPHFPTAKGNDHCREVLGVNYVQCLALYEGWQSAGRLSQQLINLYPTSVELVILHARIQERLGGIRQGLDVFGRAISRWPVGQPGVLRLWNQYAAHGLVWVGKSSALEVLSRSVASLVKRFSDQFQEKLSAPQMSGRTVASSENVATWNDVKEHYLTLTTPSSGRPDESGSVQAWDEEDMVYGLINLALVEALSGDPVAAQSTISRATKIAVSERESRQCWKELASLQVSGPVINEDELLLLLDRCKTECYNYSQLKPLSSRIVEDLKRPQVRKFFVDLLGLSPVDHSWLNTVLEICYGPSFLPVESSGPKNVLRFAEGILEAAPGNVEVALSLCRLVFRESGSARSKPLSYRIWASALLLGSLQQSCPVAPEAHWVEAALFLKQLSKGKSLEEYHLHALTKYPLSAALQHGLVEARSHIQESDRARGLQQFDKVREGPDQVEVLAPPDKQILSYKVSPVELCLTA
ncbi:hypothetical protein R1sor_010792 [Riccia sorocarpa]|uniref:C3H1-type domain-containing protein n=1 Tax=Riccia sorocarpa TaxID=122646 RepID=A0ABD3I336_9MARC